MHTSAHQANTFRVAASGEFMIPADAYRGIRSIGSTNPVFHRMEGARRWSRNQGEVAAMAVEGVERIPRSALQVKDPNPPYHGKWNLMQKEHTHE